MIVKHVGHLDGLNVSNIAQLIIYNGFDCSLKKSDLDLMEYV